MKKILIWLLCIVFTASIAFVGISCKEEAVEEAVEEEAVEEEAVEEEAVEEEVEEVEEEAAPAEKSVIKLPWEPEQAFEFIWFNMGSQGIFLFDRLLTTDESLNTAYPALAEEWSVSDDGLEYNLKLRDDIYWHDNEKITVDDVKWSFETALLNPRTQTFVKTTVANFEGAEEFTNGEADNISGIIVDGQNIKFKLIEPYSFMPVLGQFAILPKHILESEDPLELHLSEFWQLPIGSGPYMITERVMGDYTLLEPFENYYNGKAKIDQVIFQGRYGDELILSEAGELDFTWTWSTDQALQIMELPGYTVTPVDVSFCRYITPNYTKPWLDDVNVRKALLLALDMGSIAKEFFGEYAEVTETMMSGDIKKTDFEESYAYNPGRARELLEEANWDWNRVIDITYYYTDKATLDFMATLQFYWGQIGIKSQPRLLTGNVGEIIYEKLTWDLIYGAFTTLEPMDLYSVLLPGGLPSAYGLEVPELVEPFEAYKKSTDDSERKALMDEAQAIYHEILPNISLFALKGFIVESDRLQRPEWWANPQYNTKFDIEKWEVVD